MTIKALEKHLENCKNITYKFFRKHNITIAFMNLDDAVQLGVSHRLHFDFSLYDGDFKKLKISEFQDLQTKQYDELYKYLETNKIEYTLYMNSVKRSWYTDCIEFSFKITKS